MLLYFKNLNIARRETTLIIGALLIFFLLVYIYFVVAMIMNATEMEGALSEEVALRSSIGDLESRYNTLRNVLTYDYARQLGFKEPKEKVFVSQKQLVQSDTKISFLRFGILNTQ